MKFAHEFKESLDREGYPPRWREAAVPYSQLKKCLKKVQGELQVLGLGRATLQQLLAAQTICREGHAMALARYNLDGHDTNQTRPLRPRLSIFLHLHHGAVVDASLSPDTRAFLQRLSAIHDPSPAVSPRTTSLNGAPTSDGPTREDAELDHHRLERIEVPLVFDGEFFNILQADVCSLDALQLEEQKSMENQIMSLGQDVSAVSRPSKFSKSDLNRWREIFELYLDAQVFFSSHERDHGPRPSAKALQQLAWFQSEVQKRGVMSKFKVPASQGAYTRFLQLNATLLQNLKFQEINKMAVSKILKKFDKRTSLGASVSFRSAVGSQLFLAENVAKKMCARISQEVISIVPQVEDYTCPICLSIAWLPVRLSCSHCFCVRCVIKMQREKKRYCPLCRGEVVMDADLSSIDHNLEKFLRTYFRKETNEKQRANEIERGIELFGPSYKHSSCGVM